MAVEILNRNKDEIKNFGPVLPAKPGVADFPLDVDNTEPREMNRV